MTHITQIACDESGSEGENLTTAQHPVFVHASVNLSLDEAEDIILSLRSATGSQAQELKSAQILKPKFRPNLVHLLRDGGPLDGRVNLYYADKSYFVVGKMIDLLVEEQAYDEGRDIVSSGHAHDLALVLHRRGPDAVGEEAWTALLRSFNDLIKAYKRDGAHQPSAAVFIAELDRVRGLSNNKLVTDILDIVWEARGQAQQYEAPPMTMLRDMEPMVPTLNAVATSWRMRLGDVPFEFVADEHWTLDEESRRHLLNVARLDIPTPDFVYPGADLRAIHVVNSKSDARVQVADILAGVGRVNALLALDGTFDDPLQEAAKGMYDWFGTWPDGSPLGILAHAEPAGYVQEYLKTVPPL